MRERDRVQFGDTYDVFSHNLHGARRMCFTYQPIEHTNQIFMIIYIKRKLIASECTLTHMFLCRKKLLTDLRLTIYIKSTEQLYWRLHRLGYTHTSTHTYPQNRRQLAVPGVAAVTLLLRRVENNYVTVGITTTSISLQNKTLII